MYKRIFQSSNLICGMLSFFFFFLERAKFCAWIDVVQNKDCYPWETSTWEYMHPSIYRNLKESISFWQAMVMGILRNGYVAFMMQGGLKGWKWSSEIEYFPSMWRALGSIPITAKKNYYSLIWCREVSTDMWTIWASNVWGPVWFLTPVSFLSFLSFLFPWPLNVTPWPAFMGAALLQAPWMFWKYKKHLTSSSLITWDVTKISPVAHPFLTSCPGLESKTYLTLKSWGLPSFLTPEISELIIGLLFLVSIPNFLLWYSAYSLPPRNEEPGALGLYTIHS